MADLSILEQRQDKRIQASLSAVVKVKENNDVAWKETADVISISRSGAGFHLERKCEIGQILSLLMPSPPHLRCYDHKKKLYRVWGLVQHCYPLALDGQTVYLVGVAFIGKFPPHGYRDNPSQSYRICGMKEDGLWKITEAQTPFVSRRNQHFRIRIDVLLELLDPEENVLWREKNVTENISSCGAAVFSNLKLNIGDCVKFTSEKHNFSSVAVIRNCHTGKDANQRLHLEFVNDEFPINEIILPVTASR